MELPALDEWGDEEWWVLSDDGRHELVVPDDAWTRLERGLDRFRSRLTGGDLPRVGAVDASGDPISDDVVRAMALGAIGTIRESPAALTDAELARFVASCANLQVICGLIAEPGDGSTDAEMAVLTDIVGRLSTESENEMLRRVRRLRSGGFRVRMRPGERDLLGHLAAQLAEILESGDASLARLFPPAYGTDEDRSREYAALADHELIASRRAELNLAIDIIDEGRTDEDGALALMRAVNGIRLVIGTRLDVSEEHDEPPPPDSPEADLWIAYHVLGSILADLLVVLRP